MEIIQGDLIVGVCLLFIIILFIRPEEPLLFFPSLFILGSIIWFINDGLNDFYSTIGVHTLFFIVGASFSGILGFLFIIMPINFLMLRIENKKQIAFKKKKEEILDLITEFEVKEAIQEQRNSLNYISSLIKKNMEFREATEIINISVCLTIVYFYFYLWLTERTQFLDLLKDLLNI